MFLKAGKLSEGVADLEENHGTDYYQMASNAFTLGQPKSALLLLAYAENLTPQSAVFKSSFSKLAEFLMTGAVKSKDLNLSQYLMRFREERYSSQTEYEVIICNGLNHKVRLGHPLSKPERLLYFSLIKKLGYQTSN